ncbi:MAG: hypothetical protein HON53_09720 [Planctomycetaceae bacterium]|nr:hypothetical protein [Planctomycetaceae bacterium]
MKRLATSAMEGRVRRTIVGACLFLGLSLLTLVASRSSGANPAAKTAVVKTVAQSALGAAPADGWTKPTMVMGAKACIRCHRSEYLAWTTTKHYKADAYLASFEAKTKEYAEAMGITEDALQTSMCANCHSTTQTNAKGQLQAISGVSCESCHGGAGSEAGWLNRHAVYGPNITGIDQETGAHRAARIEFCEDAGMVRTARTYAIAKNCQQCHSVTNEKLVNAGHKIGGGFELVGWSLGESRHNYHMDQTTNGQGPSLWKKTTGGDIAARKRVKFIVGLLTDLEVSLNALGSATDGEGDFVGAYVERIGGSLEIFEGIVESLEDAEIEEFEAVSEAIEGAEVEDADFSEQDARDTAKEAAKTIAGIAMKFAARDGSKLAGVDEFMNDEVVELKGKAYSRTP